MIPPQTCLLATAGVPLPLSSRLCGCRRLLSAWHQELQSAVITLASVELLRGIHKDQFALGRLHLKDQAPPMIWNAVLAA